MNLSERTPKSSGANRPTKLEFYSKATFSLSTLTFRNSCPVSETAVTMSTQPLLQRTASKRIALPVRVEPKVAFANERTFLSWLHFTVVLGGLAVGLLNFGDKVRNLFQPHYAPPETTAPLGWENQCGYVLNCWCASHPGGPLHCHVNIVPYLLAMAIMIYALYTYHWRAASIRRGGRGPYDDRLGPVRFSTLFYPLATI